MASNLLRRSSRPVKKKKFFIDEIDNIYSVKKNSSSSQVSQNETTVEANKNEEKPTKTSPDRPRLSKLNITFISKKKPISRCTNLGAKIKKRYVSLPSRKKFMDLRKNLIKQKKDNSPIIVQDNSIDQCGRWKPLDDLKLIINAIQCSDLRRVKQCVKFTCKFTLQDIEERWYNLLYDPVISSLFKKALSNQENRLDLIKQCYDEAIFSEDEERVLFTLISTRKPTLNDFDKLLKQYPSVFLPTRTPQHLIEHWTLMKFHTLLPDQIINAATLKWHIPLVSFANAQIDPNMAPELCFEDMEKLLLLSNEIGDSLTNTSNNFQTTASIDACDNSSDDTSALNKSDPIHKMAPFIGFQNYGSTLYGYGGVKSNVLSSHNWVFNQEYELNMMHRVQIIDKLETQLPIWDKIVDKETDSPPDFDDTTFAILQGRMTQFLIKTREVSFGRYANNYADSVTGEKALDINLSLEGPCRKVSRHQGHIKLKSMNGANNLVTYDFYITNEGKISLLVEGKPVMPGQASKVRDKATIEISYLRFTFLINSKLVNKLKDQSS